MTIFSNDLLWSLPHFMGARLGICSIVSDVNHFKHVHSAEITSAWMVNSPFTYTPSRKKQAPSKEIVLRWIDQAWRQIPVDLTMRSVMSCGISNALDGTENDAVWDDKEEEAEDQKSWLTMSLRQTAKPRTTSRWGQPSFQTNVLFRATPVLFRTNKSDKNHMINIVCLLFIHLKLYIYILISV